MHIYTKANTFYVQIQLQGKGGRALGALTAVALAGGTLACTWLLVNSAGAAFAAPLPAAWLQLSAHQKYQLAGRTT